MGVSCPSFTVQRPALLSHSQQVQRYVLKELDDLDATGGDAEHLRKNGTEAFTQDIPDHSRQQSGPFALDDTADACLGVLRGEVHASGVVE